MQSQKGLLHVYTVTLLEIKYIIGTLLLGTYRNWIYLTTCTSLVPRLGIFMHLYEHKAMLGAADAVG